MPENRVSSELDCRYKAPDKARQSCELIPFPLLVIYLPQHAGYGPGPSRCSPAPLGVSSGGQGGLLPFLRGGDMEGRCHSTVCRGGGLCFCKTGYGSCDEQLRDPDSTASHHHPRPLLTKAVLPARFCSPLPSPPFQSSCTVFLARVLAVSPCTSCVLLIAGNLCKSPNIWILGSGRRVCV